MNRQTPIDLEQNPKEKGYTPAPVVAEPRKTSLLQPPAQSRRARWLWVTLLVIAAVAGYLYWPKIKTLVTPKKPATAAGTKSKGGGGQISVVAVKAQRGNIGVYYTALGAVTPINTVTIKSRVDGQLMQVLFREGQTVHQGDLLLEIDPRPYQATLDLAEGALARDQALLKNAKIDQQRYKTLFTQQAVPEQQMATQDALVLQYEGTIKSDQAAVDTAKLNLTYSRITAPITGLIGLRLVDPGNIVHATDTNGLLVITQMDPISVIFTLAEDQLPTVLDKIHAGRRLGVEAWDRDLKAKLAMGTLQTIDNQIDPTTGTLKLRADFDNRAGKLFPSQFVNARLLIEERHGVTLVPNAAIQRNSQTTYVWLVNPDHTVKVQPITTGVSEGEQTQIMSGLKPGDTVVTVGVDRLQDGSKVNVEIPADQPAKK